MESRIAVVYPYYSPQLMYILDLRIPMLESRNCHRTEVPVVKIRIFEKSKV